MITYLINKLPAVRRLHAQLEESRGISNDQSKRITEDGRTITRLAEELDHTKKKRNKLHRQVDEMGTTIIKQAATIDGMALVRNHAETLINEQKLIIADLRSREERWERTVQSLNDSLKDRLSILADLREELAAAQTELEARTRPVLFALAADLSEAVLADALAGKEKQLEIRALIQLLDACAVEAMNEAASAPVATISEGPHASRGFTSENRTFSAGGVFALTELKRRITELLAPKAVQPEQGRAAA